MKLRRLALTLVCILGVGVGATACAPGESSAQAAYAEYSSSIPQLRTERAKAATACMAEQGFPGLEVSADGSVAGEIPTEQSDAYDTASIACYQQVCPTCGEPLDAAAWERLYSLELVAAQCLDDAGLDVPAAPSLQTYLDSPEEERWSPHRLLAQEISLADGDLAERCPDPSGFVSYW